MSEAQNNIDELRHALEQDVLRARRLVNDAESDLYDAQEDLGEAENALEEFNEENGGF